MEFTLFDILKDILFSKKNKFTNSSEEQLNFYPYMLQRWASMSSRDNTLIINETTNKWLTISTAKQHIYKLYHSILPQQRQKKVAYIKKASNSDKEEDINNISNAAELSNREIKELLKIKTYLKL